MHDMKEFIEAGFVSVTGSIEKIVSVSLSYLALKKIIFIS